MDWKFSFDPFAGHDTADGERFFHAAPCSSNDGPRKNLNPLFFSFKDLRVNVDRVTNLEFGWISSQAGTRRDIQ
jgi:hypothetical protein